MKPIETTPSPNRTAPIHPLARRMHRALAAGFFLGGLAILSFGGCQKQEPSGSSTGSISATTSPTPPAPPSPVSAEPNSFDEVAAQLDLGGSFYAYVSTESWIAGLAAQFGSLRDILLATPNIANVADRKTAETAFQIVTNLCTHSGIGQVTGVGASSFALEPGLYRSKVFIHHHAGKGDGVFWSAFGKTPHPLIALELLPADTALAGFGDLDLAAVVAFLRREVEQSGVPEAQQGLAQMLKEFPSAAGMTLEEALGSLGGSLGFVLTLDSAKRLELPVGAEKISIPAPRAALLVQVKDDRIFKRLDQLLAASPGLVKTDEAGLQMRTLPSPLPPPVELRPTVALWGGYLIFATDDQLVRALIAAKTTGKGFKSAAEFAKLTAGLPAEGNSFQLATAAFGETVARVQREMVKGQPGTTAEQLAMIEKLLGSQKAGSTFSVSAHLPNGWLAVGKGSQGASQLLAPALIVPAIGAGIALPVFSKVQERAKATKSLSNARQIAVACMIYATDNNGKFPPNLAALVPDYLPVATIFVSPFAPDELEGYTYHVGLTQKSPPKAVLLEDKFAGRENSRVIVHVDGSGEVVPAAK